MTAQAGKTVFGDPAIIDAAHRTVRADGSIQFDLPLHQATQNPPPLWLTDLLDAMQNFVKWVGGGWQILMWLAIAAAILALVFVLFAPARAWFAARLGRPRQPADPPRWAPQAATAHALLEAADRLAAAGHYAQAIRLILHRSIADIEQWRGDPLAPSLTGRDISRFDRLPDTARAVFRRFVADVERSLFAGNALTQADWTRARADYAGFALGPT